MGKRRLSVSAERTINTYSFLHIAALQGTEQAESSEEGQFYNCMSSIMFTAFCIEAYLNHVAPQLLPHWYGAIERSLSVHSKLEIICDQLDIKVDFSRRPFQSFRNVMKYRNLLAHGRTVKEELGPSTQLLSNGEHIRYPETWWEDHTTLEFAKQWLHDIETIIDRVHQAAGLGTTAFGIHSIGTASGRLIE